jgi:DNA-directed RNA polymerase subunit N (RpoN/RPB10)
VSSIFVAYYIGVVVDCDERIERHLLERLFESRTESKPFEQQKERLLEEISVRRYCCWLLPAFHSNFLLFACLVKSWNASHENLEKQKRNANKESSSRPCATHAQEGTE